MKKDEFLKRVQGLKEHLGGWEIVVDHLDKGEYILGCYYDNEDCTWKVYINEERGLQSIRLSTPIEDKAFDKLFSIVEFEYRIINR